MTAHDDTQKIKAFLEFTEDGTRVELPNVDIGVYWRPTQKITSDDYIQSDPDKPKMVIITSSVPDDLKERIEEVVKKYCNL